jgi:hypothetical protein
VVTLTDAKRVTALKQVTRFYCARMLGVIEAKHEFEWLDDVSEQHSSVDRAARQFDDKRPAAGDPDGA